MKVEIPNNLDAWTSSWIGETNVDYQGTGTTEQMLGAKGDFNRIYILKSLLIYTPWDLGPEFLEEIKQLQLELKVALVAIMVNTTDTNDISPSSFTPLKEVLVRLEALNQDPQTGKEIRDLIELAVSDPKGFRSLVGAIFAAKGTATVKYIGAKHFGENLSQRDIEINELVSKNQVVFISMLARGMGVGFWDLLFRLDLLEGSDEISHEEVQIIINEGFGFAASTTIDRGDPEKERVESGISLNAFERILALDAQLDSNILDGQDEEESEYRIILCDDVVVDGRTFTAVLTEIYNKLLGLSWDIPRIARLFNKIDFAIGGGTEGVNFVITDIGFEWKVEYYSIPLASKTTTRTFKVSF